MIRPFAILLAALSCAWGAVASAAAAPPAPPTFTADIAPIVFSQCADCHRPGGSAPFDLLTYREVKRHARAIVDTTRRRYMPPWKPDPGAGDFEGVRRLTDAQIDLIQRWVDGGAVEGDPSALPRLPTWSSTWTLGEPDLVLAMDAPYTLRAAGEDMYRHFVLPVPISRTRYVKAWELRVSNTRVVHHATMEIDPTGTSRALDAQDPEPGYEGLIAHTVTRLDGFFLDWAPGHTPYVAPENMSFPIDKGSDLVLMLHLRPSGKPETVQVSVGLYFSETPPTRVPAMLRLTRQDFVIEAGERQHVVTSSYRLPVGVDVYTVQPHAHYLARAVEAVATLPNGTKRTLIAIAHWDFNWQDVYRYRTPVALPAGTTVTMKWTYDNSEDNPVNPTRPPRRVTFGQRTSDEMSELWFQVYPRNAADRDRLVRSLAASIQDQNLAGYEAMIAANPDDVSLRNDAAELYAQAGHVDGAARHFAEVVRLAPDSAAAAYNLGTVRLRQSNLDEARHWFEKAVALDPTYANAYRSLGVIAQQTGRLDEAFSEYRKAIALAPRDAMSHHNLAVFLQSTGRSDQALEEYREAVRLNPALPDAHYGLALVLKQQGRLTDAIAEYRRALRLRPDWPAVRRELDAALAAAQR
ncbi:MAG TPA: tetratricopeptide repeat protein [Vicinamibacterales bacterium]|nr:tetratricopeptide repeat protein [Vicinamibacterales bacterium]